jgi:hypothetical protein
MRYVILACVVALAGSLDLVVLIAASDDSLAAFELHHPALLLPIIAGGARNLASAATLLLRELLDAIAAPYREPGPHTRPAAVPLR